MSAWEQITENETIAIDLTENESRVFDAIVEGIRAGRSLAMVSEGKSSWEIIESLWGKDYWNTSEPKSSKPSSSDLVINDKEAEAIEDASGEMGMEPPTRETARRKLADRKTAMDVMNNLRQGQTKYVSTLGQQGYSLLMRKLVRALGLPKTMSGPQPAAAGGAPIGKVDLQKVRAQDVAGRAGAQRAGETDWSKGKATVQDPATQKRTPDQEDPSKWNLEVRKRS